MSAPPDIGTSVVSTVEAMRSASRHLRRQGSLALVPTMGALHPGHLSLVSAAKTVCHSVVVSIFVNPLQFGPSEDFERYPRTLERDLELLSSVGVDAVFAPSVQEMHPPHASTVVHVQGLSERLDGLHRPGHFAGVSTVVAKLFHIVQPDAAFFGQKDAAQVAVLRAMTRDLHLPIDLHVQPTVREPDGLALSSRNRYLTPQDRKVARILYRALRAAQRAFAHGCTSVPTLLELLRDTLQSEPRASVEYAEIVSPDTLLPLTIAAHGDLCALAVRIGDTRLIDNLLLDANPHPEPA